jgi:chitinase
MKGSKLLPLKLLVIALTLGMLGCSGEKKAPKEPTEKANSEATEIPVPVDPLVTETVTKPEAQEIGPRSIAYFTSWSCYDRALTVKDIDPKLLTHINFAFANIKEDGEVEVGDEEADVKMDFGTELGGNPEDAYGHFGQLRQLKLKYPELKVLISIGGWSWSSNFSDIAADPGKRDKFASSAVEFITKYNMDGVDIDWEYPVEGGNNITHRVEDNVNYALLLKATRKALNEQSIKDGKIYLLSIAARAAGRFIYDANLSESMKYLDYINLMTYDFHGSWENVTGFNSPLYDNTGNEQSMDATVNAFVKAGIDPKDLNLGLAFYGRGWTKVAGKENNGIMQPAQVPTGIGYGKGTWETGVFDTWDIIENYVGKNGYVRYYDETAECPYVFDGTNWIGYDDEQSIKAKTEYAMEKGLGGVMFWEFAGDKNKVLQRTIAEVLGLKKVE